MIKWLIGNITEINEERWKVLVCFEKVGTRYEYEYQSGSGGDVCVLYGLAFSRRGVQTWGVTRGRPAYNSVQSAHHIWGLHLVAKFSFRDGNHGPFDSITPKAVEEKN